MPKFLLTLHILLCTFRVQAQSNFKFCGAAYAVKHFLLPESINRLPAPDVLPKYLGSKDSLKAYFSDKEIQDEYANELIWKVHISFKVNCRGESGDFELLGDGMKKLKDAREEVLLAVKNMPQKWRPAIKDNKPVDCYHVVEFTMQGRSLKEVACREIEKD